VAGGQAALDAIAASGFDPRSGAPRPRPANLARRMVALLWTSAREREVTG
jgi:hypothetical protein